VTECFGEKKKKKEEEEITKLPAGYKKGNLQTQCSLLKNSAVVKCFNIILENEKNRK